MKVSIEREQVKVAEAARMLGCCGGTVRRMVRNGYLTWHTMPGAGLRAARYIPMHQIRDIVYGRRSFQRIDQAAEAGGAASWKNGDWFERDALLQAKAGRLASFLGVEPILALLTEIGVKRIGDCNPDQQRTLNGHLLRLAGYSRTSRTTAWRRRKEREARDAGVEEWEKQ